MTERMFPIIAISYQYDQQIRELRKSGSSFVVVQMPWDLLAPHEAQAQRNHRQSLTRLAERGGLSACEAVAIMEDRPYHRMSAADANDRLAELILIRYRPIRKLPMS